MTYRIDRSQFIENGPTIAANAAIARVRKAALYAALAKHKRVEEPADLKQAA
ncbi:MAG: hypothetical protein ABIU10_04555 [Sphingomicrobium sp.]